MTDDDDKKINWVGNSPGGNYTTKAAELAKKLGVGISHIGVAHDDDCAIFRRKPCNCDPDVFLMTDKP